MSLLTKILFIALPKYLFKPPETAPTAFGMRTTNLYRHRHRVGSREAVRILVLRRW